MRVRGHEAENDAERERLRALVARLSDDELRRAMPGGWTVAGVLGHAGFWDARVIALLDRYARGVAPSTDDYEPATAVDWVNDSAKPFILALAPRDAAALTLRLAEDADRKVAALSDEMLAKLDAAGPAGAPFNLSRAEHRREHLDEIEAALRA
ncbi:MAG TPA: maleylpyruvate isomerase N-terminal domain-containing protein [Candidatus Limnocylindria bacterium]|nr:maleylpyruvate isomerase N-terminal domain-containing protein [Candidatus Limnocylindria bacterium]